MEASCAHQGWDGAVLQHVEQERLRHDALSQLPSSSSSGSSGELCSEPSPPLPTYGGGPTPHHGRPVQSCQRCLSLGNLGGSGQSADANAPG
jgi:hypothetical protein